MYVRRIKAMHISFELSTVRRVAEEQALLDSGASENLINEETWKTLGIGAFALPKPITIYNVDGTENKQGKITRYCWLKVKKGNQQQRMKFFLTDIGKDHFILGYPFLHAFNPEMNWKEGQMLGPTVRISTTDFQQIQRLLRQTQLRAIRAHGRWPRKGETIYYRRVTTTQETAHNWQKEQARATTGRLPGKHKRHRRVFGKDAARQLPPNRIVNMKIPSHHSAPEITKHRVYPLTREEEAYVRQFLNKGQRKGHTYLEAPPIAFPASTKEKKGTGRERITTNNRQASRSTA